MKKSWSDTSAWAVEVSARTCGKCARTPGNNIAQAAVCDVSSHRLNSTKNFVSKNSDDKVEAYTDYRKVIGLDIDAWSAPHS